MGLDEIDGQVLFSPVSRIFSVLPVSFCAVAAIRSNAILLSPVHTTPEGFENGKFHSENPSNVFRSHRAGGI